MKIIAFAGKPLAGKSEAARIARELGYRVIVMGDVVREEVMKRGLQMEDRIVGSVATELREKEGKDVIARRCIQKIKDQGIDDDSILIIDGIRSIDEVNRFKKEFGEDFILISITAPPEMRYERARKRKREDDVASIEELLERDRRELSWGMGEALEEADIKIENTGTLEDFREKIRRLLEDLG